VCVNTASFRVRCSRRKIETDAFQKPLENEKLLAKMCGSRFHLARRFVPAEDLVTKEISAPGEKSGTEGKSLVIPVP